MSEENEERLLALEARVRLLEDKLEIFNLLATFGPLVDSLSAEATPEVWTNDAVYDFGNATLAGDVEIANLVNLETHKDYVDRGCAHVISMPKLSISGDHAVATGYSRVYLNDADGWKVERASANRWDLRRTDDGWRVESRINRLLDGTQDAMSILAQGVAESSTGSLSDRKEDL